MSSYRYGPVCALWTDGFCCDVLFQREKVQLQQPSSAPARIHIDFFFSQNPVFWSTVIIPLGAPLHRWRLLMPPPMRLNHPLPKRWSNQSLHSRSHGAVTRVPRSWEAIKQEECSTPAARLNVERRRNSHGDLVGLHACSFRSRQQCEPVSDSKLSNSLCRDWCLTWSLQPSIKQFLPSM